MKVYINFHRIHDFGEMVVDGNPCYNRMSGQGARLMKIIESYIFEWYDDGDMKHYVQRVQNHDLRKLRRVKNRNTYVTLYINPINPKDRQIVTLRGLFKINPMTDEVEASNYDGLILAIEARRRAALTWSPILAFLF